MNQVMESSAEPNLQDAFKAMLEKRKAINKRNKAVAKAQKTDAVLCDRPTQEKAALRAHFLEQCLSYQGTHAGSCSPRAGAACIAPPQPSLATSSYPRYEPKRDRTVGSTDLLFVWG